MILPKVLIVISTFFCLSGVISAACPKSSYTASQGTVLSPGFNTSESYGDDLSCTYNIRVPVGHRITLEFKTLSILGTMPNCTEDSLEIFVGCSNTSVGKFCSCSDLSMPKIYSRDNCMTLVFKSDGSKRGRGFEAFYTSTDNNVTKLDSSSNCSTKFQNYSSHGAIFTPNWPLKYPKSSSCSWTFHPPQSKVVRVFFSSFELEDKNDNFHDCDPDRDPLKGDDIRINGTKITGEQVTIKGRICFPPEVSFFPVKSMKAVEVRFKANANQFIGNGVIAGYATYKEGTLESSDPGCKSLSVTPGTSSTSSTHPPTTATGVEVAGITFGSLACIAIIAFINVVHLW